MRAVLNYPGIPACSSGIPRQSPSSHISLPSWHVAVLPIKLCYFLKFFSSIHIDRGFMRRFQSRFLNQNHFFVPCSQTP